MIHAEEMRNSLEAALPSLELKARSAIGELQASVCGEMSGVANVTILSERGGRILSARVALGAYEVVCCFLKKYRTEGAIYEIHAPDAEITNGQLRFGSSASWERHPASRALEDERYAEGVTRSWAAQPTLVVEEVDEHGSIVKPGLRPPQVGAIHALAAHWSVKSVPATVVLPTGTGKTDVMISASMLVRSKRTLVLVPSDALRTQISDHFRGLGVLRLVGAVGEEAKNPVVARMTRAPKDACDQHSLMPANVVVSTTQLVQGLGVEDLQRFLGGFELIVFDEAHHVPAPSWAKVHGCINRKTKVLLVTATPYRNDGKRLPGEIIYQFPLRMAQQQGYFTKISVTRVHEEGREEADAAIAGAAIQQLRSDQAIGYTHLVLARASSKEHADLLLAEYARQGSELNPVVLHSDLPKDAQRSAVRGLREGRNRIVICVDMLGEGFDLPSLKIAAMHEVHKSLPVTLQFVGRFTRSSGAVGGATVILNMAEPMAETAISELFNEDADWNEIVPELSASAIKSQEDVQAFTNSMRDLVKPEDVVFDLASLAPKLSVSMYSVDGFQPGRLSVSLGKNSVVHQSWVNASKDLLVAITRDVAFPDWTAAKGAAGFTWNLSIFSFDEDRRLIYANSTLGQSKIFAIARALGGRNSKRISGERMFRVFHGLHRSILQNVGLYRRGNIRFQMLAGVDIGTHVSSAVQAGSSKSNLFATGYDDGKKVNVGASFKGGVWSMSPTSIPDWLAWSNSIAAKLSDDTIPTNTFLQFAMIPVEVTERPQVDIFTCVPPDELLPGDYYGERKISVYAISRSYNQLDLDFSRVTVSGTDVLLDIAVDGAHVTTYVMRWGETFVVSHSSGPRIRVMDGGEEIDMGNFLSLNPPALLLVDGSELVGPVHLKHPGASPYTFLPSSILPLNWGTTPITLESKWKNGAKRPSSVQGYMIDRCISLGTYDFVIDDDDSGEAADIITITEEEADRELHVTLFHCKYASAAIASARYGDLYEVCGQAVKSCRLLNRPEELLAHIARREGRLGGRPTRFELGDLATLSALQRRVSSYRMRLRICVVQPGLSAEALSPELSAVLAAADGFVLEFTGRPLQVYGSE